MILSTLTQYYDRLAAQEDSDIAPLGFSRQKIGLVIVLNIDGTLSDFQESSIEDNGRKLSRQLVVPGQAKPSGSGINPGFLWDSSQYMLGFKVDDPKPARTLEAFEAFRDRHLELEKKINDPAFTAVCEFLRKWKPSKAAEHPKLADITGSFGVFRIAGASEFVHERPRVNAYWLAMSSQPDADALMAPSLISGEVQPIARLHEPKIKGVRGAQTAGATLVSFNDDAYESYGKSQSFNAPVGVEDAFKYCTALNSLTTSRQRSKHLGDTTVVFWSGKPTQMEDMFGQVLESSAAEDQQTIDQVGSFFDALKRAVAGSPVPDGDVPFYILGLAPNAARISVRFWLVGTVQQFAERIGRHLADMELSGGLEHAPRVTLQRILDQTARERDEIAPLVGGAVLNAILSGGQYPWILLSSVLRRIRADGQTSGINGHIRASIIKAVLVRRARINQQKESVGMALEKENPNIAYRLGRLFAVLEKVQEEAIGGEINSTIKDKFLSSASANPIAVFPRLLRLHAHHLRKLGAEKRGLMIVREQLVQEICGSIKPDMGFPTQLPLEDQGLFFIGYYQQRQDLFTSKKSESREGVEKAQKE